MKLGLYPRLAFDGIRKNKQLYLPYSLTCVGMIMMYYIICFLYRNPAVASLQGGDLLTEMLFMGSQIIAVFAGVFLFYTNSFLIRRRKKEFGLYNILGMGKFNISIILLWETLITAVFSLVAGLILGIAFSKMAELGLVNLMKGQINYTLSVSPESIFAVFRVFSVYFLLLFLNTVRQVKFANAITLLKSENAGEKPPKANWLLGILGVLILGAAYYLAVNIEEPAAALVLFFVAVLLVIIGTYLVMIAGSVLFCRILQKKKNYYYKPNHFVSTASMVYRMKRNGAGLASICILSTMVLVMISSTAALYFGNESALYDRYPRKINMEFHFAEIESLSDENIGKIQELAFENFEKHETSPVNSYQYRCASFAGLLLDNTIETDVTKVNNFNPDTYSDVFQFHVIPLSDYNAAMGAAETLNADEVLIYTYRSDYEKDTISLSPNETFRIKKHLDSFIKNGESAMMVIPTMFVVVPDIVTATEELTELVDYRGSHILNYSYVYNFDTPLEKEAEYELYMDLFSTFKSSKSHYPAIIERRDSLRESFFALSGSLFYLGILLSVVFILATVLIIYYKQISEGYEDQSRFEIMQKIGMTKKDIRRSINSQLLTVFFLPLIFAGCHLLFAFPVIRKLLLLFSLNNVALFAATTIISFLVFGLFYVIVYKMTSNAYYRIVSTGMNEEH